MNPKPFLLERYFAQYEFNTRYLLSSSDCDGVPMNELLALASPHELELWNKLTLGYTESSGLPELRDSIARQYTSINPSQVLVLSPGEANFGIMNVLLKKGDHVVCMAPAYQSLYEIARTLQCELSFWRPSSESPWRFDPEDLAKLVRANTRLIIINFPHNPTGFSPSENELKKIIQIADKSGAYLFSDEMYSLLVRKPDYQLPPVCDLYDRGISLWGMAKSFGLAGLRIGWIASRDKHLMQLVSNYKDYLTICSSAPSEILALIGLHNATKLAKRNNDIIASNGILFDAFCRQTGLFEFTQPKTGSTAFVRLTKQEPTMEFSERLVKHAGIMTLPAEMFEYGNRHIRIGLGRKNLPEALAAFADHVKIG